MRSHGSRRASLLADWFPGHALRALILGVLCVLPAGSQSACRCDADEVVATLAKHAGTVQRDFSATVEQWSGADDGAEMRMGDGVRTLDQSTAELRLVAGARLDMTPRTVIRFLTSPSEDEVGIEVMVGEATLAAGAHGVRVVSSLGALVINPRSRVALARDKQRMRFEVLVGNASVELPRGGVRALSNGQSLTVDIGGVVLDTPPTVPGGVPRLQDSGGATFNPEGAGLIHVTADGRGVSMRPPGGSWIPMGSGQQAVEAATSLRVPSGATARVDRGEQSVSLGQGEYVLGPDGEALVQVSTGPVRLRSAAASLRVPGGIIVAKSSNASADVRVAENGTELDVHLGTVEVRTTERNELAGGESASIGPDGKTTVVGRGPGAAHLVSEAGQSFTIHDPTPPTVVAMESPLECTDGAIVRTGRKHWASRGRRIHVPYGPGHHEYTVHCLSADGPVSKPAASGAITVVRDSGVAPIAENAPRTQIATDGRAYTVLYQHRLPIVSVTWPSPPAGAESFTLHVGGAGGDRTVQVPAPSHVFPSGALREGRHTFYFSASTEPPRRSRATTVNIVYDSATPTLSIRNSPSSMPGPGVEVTLAGTAVPGWSVSIDGKPVAVDSAMRFSASSVVPRDGRAVAIRFQHPTKGTHYYLRRPGGVP